MLRNPNSFSRRLGFRQMPYLTRGGGFAGGLGVGGLGGRHRFLSRKLFQLFLFVIAFSLLLYFQSSLHIRISVPRSRQDLVRRFSNPAKLGARIHARGVAAGAGASSQKIYATGKSVSDDWDWDETDPYDRHYAAVIEEEDVVKPVKGKKGGK